MARNTITRTITTSKIHTVSVAFENGTPTIKHNEPITVNHEVTDKEVAKLIKKTYGTGATLEKVETSETLYSLSVDDFLKYAKPVKAGEAEAEETAE